MFDAPHPLSSLQRTRGRACVGLGAGARIMELSQEGAAKVFLPRSHGPWPEAVFLNTSGGLTGGDRLAYQVTLAEGARAVATTQTAERAYASAGGWAELEVALRLGPGAALDWLPQETILFNRSALRRRTVADLSADARLLICEMVVLGRAAMGEVLAELELRDWREVRRDGRPVLVEPLRLAAGSLAGGSALIGGARAFATVALIAPGAEDALAAVRAALGPTDGGDGVEAAASGWDGKCVVRLRAADALPLKRAVAKVLKAMRGRALPRVWQI
ncbi:urease accessory protein UreD [Defluviimonas sp. 20V17]|uniref:Urease accessory protein UreD n=1 Tax=Allgaiera indica TaxID=765699 RepID=A0AAN4ZZM7_9RHOB|nr:urease accessory protein UreD [Allgaiera indica]KDB04595.1 urease accessory protein UreD [Defluviimonas sp. 20V17]GHE02580.1 urease accessory protein UreD [Allgaiera indica]SDX85697.1 urease accessory protein [Allgaiera indica]